MRFLLWIVEVLFAAAPVWISFIADKVFEPAGVLALCPASGKLVDCKAFPTGPWMDFVVLAFALFMSAIFSLAKYIPKGEPGKVLQGGVVVLAVMGLFASTVLYVLLSRQVLHTDAGLWIVIVVLIGLVVSLVSRLASKT